MLSPKARLQQQLAPFGEILFQLAFCVLYTNAFSALVPRVFRNVENRQHALGNRTQAPGPLLTADRVRSLPLEKI